MIKKVMIAIPGVAAALLPNVTCPACWPVYAGVLSSLGLGFLMTGPYFFLVVSALLGISLFSLYYKADSRHGYGPILLGLLAAGVILAGKAAGASNYVLYSGAAALITASLWNRWPKKRVAVNRLGGELAICSCSSCNIDGRRM